MQQQLDKVNKELQDLQDLNKTLIAINEEFGRENNNLYEKLELYKNLKRSSNMQVKKRKRPKSDNEDYEGGSSSEESRDADPNNDAYYNTEINEKRARVCMIFNDLVVNIY